MRHFVGQQKTTAFKAIPGAVKLGTVMSVATFTPKGATMTQGGTTCGGFHLTFDDGPYPVQTPALLDWL